MQGDGDVEPELLVADEQRAAGAARIARYMSAKLAPARTMKSARIHCASAENALGRAGPAVEKPPVGIVEKACARASYGVIASSIPYPAERARASASGAR